MSKKPRFKPGITRVKLNPEQAVLACNCYTIGFVNYFGQPNGYDTLGEGPNVCQPGAKGVTLGYGGNRVASGVTRESGSTNS